MLSLQSSLSNHYNQRVKQYDLNLSIVRYCLQKGASVKYSLFPTENQIEITVNDLRSHVPSGNYFSMNLVGKEMTNFLDWVDRNPQRIIA